MANSASDCRAFLHKSTSNFKALKNIFESGELERDATISKMETVVNRGFRGSTIEVVDHYKDDKDIDRLIDSLAESIKKFRKNMGEPTLGDDFISDASKKSTLARSTKDF